MKVFCAQYADSALNRFHPTSIVPVHRIEQFTPVEGDVGVFLGGADIHPSLYGHRDVLTPHAQERGPSPRDVLEMQMMYRCIETGTPMIGFCRGAQLLCIGAGGTLVQHVNNHLGQDHPLILSTGKVIRCNSVHHQMMRLKGIEHSLLGWAPPMSKTYTVDQCDPVTDVEFNGGEPEIVWFPLIKGIGFQFHPEYDFTSDFGRVAQNLINTYIFGKIQ